MKNLLKPIACVIPFFYMIALFSGYCPEQKAIPAQQIEQIYILPEQLSFGSEGIFVNLDDRWLRTEAIFSDANGIYIQNRWPQENGCGEGLVPCRNCQRCVKDYYDICPHCEKPV